ncbi:hypothetical protein LQ948_11890 [Jiella sp. MQZ9-1]|uniref:Uncharacterized protein n=1 Tax=Jiella flava TaxID=2816857 RepID=A0A939JXG3_9HYPH|nr:hypothetical protein [Jiella flava]MBO0663336.1 hypothetical protein [Jiella flava]MCD2471912.1 hypothetical protein [Jiella flava]
MTGRETIPYMALINDGGGAETLQTERASFWFEREIVDRDGFCASYVGII